MTLEIITSRTFGETSAMKRGAGTPNRFEDEVNALVGVAAARGHGVGQAGAALEFRVANRRTDGVRVGVPVSDDQYFAHGRAKVESRAREGGKESHSCVAESLPRFR